jgi:hypothetical protein
MRRRVRLNLDLLEARENPSAYAVLTAADGAELFRVAPYGTDFTGGVRSVQADVTGDGVADLIAAPGSGVAPTVKVYDGVTHALVASFDAYESTFAGGVNVAAADLTGDGKAEIIVGADLGGGPRVRVLDGATIAAAGGPTAIVDFLAIEDSAFRGGVRIAAGDITGDGVADLIVGAGDGGGPRVAGYDGAALGQGVFVRAISDFFSFDPGLRGGTSVRIEDVTGDGVGDLLFGAGPGVQDRYVDGALLRAINAGNPAPRIYQFFANDIAYPHYDKAGHPLTQLIPYMGGGIPVDTPTVPDTSVVLSD